MRICLIVILSLLFGCAQDEPHDPTTGPCQAWREETGYMIWTQGCIKGMDSLYGEQKPHIFFLSEHCTNLYLLE